MIPRLIQIHTFYKKLESILKRKCTHSESENPLPDSSPKLQYKTKQQIVIYIHK